MVGYDITVGVFTVLFMGENMETMTLKITWIAMDSGLLKQNGNHYARLELSIDIYFRHEEHILKFIHPFKIWSPILKWVPMGVMGPWGRLRRPCLVLPSRMPPSSWAAQRGPLQQHCLEMFTNPFTGGKRNIQKRWKQLNFKWIRDPLKMGMDSGRILPISHETSHF